MLVAAILRKQPRGASRELLTRHHMLAQAADESVLTPRFYTTDFEEMEQMFSLELNPNLNMEELEVSPTLCACPRGRPACASHAASPPTSCQHTALRPSPFKPQHNPLRAVKFQGLRPPPHSTTLKTLLCMSQAMLHEFKLDYNQKHFVRNETFKKAADRIQVRHIRGTSLPILCEP